MTPAHGSSRPTSPTPSGSETSKSGQSITAVIAEPIFNPNHTIAIPQGATLVCQVTRAKPARRFGRTGVLSFNFSRLTLPNAETQTVETRLTGADSAQDITLNSEGQAKSKPQDKLSIPLALALLASRPLDRDCGHRNGCSGNSAGKSGVGGAAGLGLIGTIVGIAGGSPYAAAGIGYWGAARAFYSRWIARGEKIAFPRAHASSSKLRPAAPPRWHPIHRQFASLGSAPEARIIFLLPRSCAPTIVSTMKYVQALFLSVLAAAMPAAAQKPYTAAKIIFLTIRALTPRHSWKRPLECTPGMKFNAADMGAAAQALVDTGFDSVGAALAPGPYAAITVMFDIEPTDRAQMVHVGFENFAWLSHAEIESALQAKSPLFLGYLPESSPLADVFDKALTDALASKGVTATVAHDTIEPNLSYPERTLEFRITAPKVRVANVKLSGVAQELVPEFRSQ